MSAKFILNLFILAAIVMASLAVTPQAFAQSTCGATYTVVRGDTLRSIASRCDTTVAAIQRANPEVRDPNRIYPGQVLVMPGAVLPGGDAYDIYIVQRGDTLNKIANRFGTTVNRLMDLNPSISNASVIYVGQRLLVPAATLPDTGSGDVYIVQAGDTLRKIAAKFNTSVDTLLRLNPQITNPNRIYTGQRMTVPSTGTTYTVQPGDTLRKIANRFDTTIDAILDLNPGIRNPNIIYVGQVIRVR